MLVDGKTGTDGGIDHARGHTITDDTDCMNVAERIIYPLGRLRFTTIWLTAVAADWLKL
jgi:hypothetical protein